MPSQAHKIRDLVILVALQFLLINGCLVALMLIWDELPKYLGGVLLFALPMAVGIGLGKILEHGFEAFSERTGAVMVIVITSILIWLPAIYPGLFVLKDYLQTSRQQTARTSVHSFRELSKAGFVTFSNGHLNPKYNTTMVTSQNVKHGDIYTRVYRYFSVTPVLWEGWRPDMPIGVFAVRESTSEIATPFDPDAIVQGLVVRDPYDVSHYRLALRQAETEHGITTVENPLLLKLSPHSFEETLRSKRLWALISMGLVNLILIGPVVYFKLKDLSQAEEHLEEQDFPDEDIDLAPPEEDPEEVERKTIRDLMSAVSSDPDPEMRREAIQILSRSVELSGDPEGLNALAMAARLDSDSQNRIAILEFFARINDESTFTHLLGALMYDESPDVRLRAVELLGEGGDPLAFRVLQDAAKSDKDQRVRDKALEFSNKIDPFKKNE